MDWQFIGCRFESCERFAFSHRLLKVVTVLVALSYASALVAFKETIWSNANDQLFYSTSITV